MTVYGWDASDFDWARGPMDLAAARADGITWFTHKATESTNVRHVHLGDALNRARSAGFEFLGAYHVVRSSPSVQAQVNYFLGYLDQQVPWWRTFPGFIMQVDLELWSYDQVSAATGIAFANALQVAQPKRVLTYASRGMYGNSLGGLGTPLWNAAYGTDPATGYRQAYPGDGGLGWTPYSGQTPVMWQYGSRTTIGSQPGCDANAYRGSVDDLRQLITGSASLAPAPMEEDDMVKLIAPTAGPYQGGVFKLYSTDLGMAFEPLSGELEAAVKLYGQEVYVSDPLLFGRPIADLRAEWQAMLAGGGRGGPTIDQIRKVVDEELDEQSLGGADKD